jgi:hypothetical protein
MDGRGGGLSVVPRRVVLPNFEFEMVSYGVSTFDHVHRYLIQYSMNSYCICTDEEEEEERCDKHGPRRPSPAACSRYCSVSVCSTQLPGRVSRGGRHPYIDGSARSRPIPYKRSPGRIRPACHHSFPSCFPSSAAPSLPFPSTRNRRALVLPRFLPCLLSACHRNNNVLPAGGDGHRPRVPVQGAPHQEPQDHGEHSPSPSSLPLTLHSGPVPFPGLVSSVFWIKKRTVRFLEFTLCLLLRTTVLLDGRNRILCCCIRPGNGEAKDRPFCS